MHAQGVTCADCHEPHSLKLRAPGNAVCAQCHLPAKFDTAQHTHHGEGTPGAACAACHMPTTTYMGVDPRHDHSLRIPRPDVSVKLGTPNACNNCHAKQNAQWAADAIGKWTDKPPTSYQNFGTALQCRFARRAGRARRAARADRGQGAARAGARERHPATRPPAESGHDRRPGARIERSRSAGAIGGGRGARERGTRDAASGIFRACWPIRCAPCGSRPRARSRAHPNRSCRRRIAPRSRRRSPSTWRRRPTTPIARRGGPTSATSMRNATMPPRPSPNIARRSASTPRSWRRTRISPTSYRARGADGEAVAVLREGLARNPRAAVLHHALGLAFVRQKQTAESLKSLRLAVRPRARKRPLRVCLRGGVEQCGTEQGGAGGAECGAEARALRPGSSCRGSRSSRPSRAIASSHWAT